MVRPARNKKPVNYSQFEDSGSDDDFISATVPLNKKAKIMPKELKQDKLKPSLKKEDILPEKNPKKRVALDDKLFQRGLEVALALSVKELPTDSSHVQQSEEEGIGKEDNGKTETVNKPPRVSNCSVTSGHIEGLDELVEEDNAPGVQGKRKAASQAKALQRKMLLEGSEDDSAGDSEPDGEESEVDSGPDSDESEGDEDFTVRKSKTKNSKKEEVKVKSTVGKKEKKSKSKCDMSATSVGIKSSTPVGIKSESPSLSKTNSLSSEAARKPATTFSPSPEGRRPKWVPPAASGGSGGGGGSGGSPLAGASAKSPSQSLRLGLSRLARVKPLHPSATSSQAW